MAKRFRHLDQDWEATATGTGHGVGFGNVAPAINRWGVIFRSVSDPSREYRGSISASDPASANDHELKEVLEEQLVIAAINRSRYVWRPAEAISRDTGLPTDRVRDILENKADDVIAGEQNGEGFWLYTTRDHLSKTSGDVMKHYQVEESS